MRTAYMHVLDAESLADLLGLVKGDVVGLDLPDAEVADNIAPRVNDSCALCRAKGSLAPLNVIEGMREPVEFGDGMLLEGTQYVPIAAFHARTYDQLQGRIAEALRNYDRVIAREFKNGKPQKPIASVGHFCVEVRGTYCYPGHVCSEYREWAITKSSPECVDRYSRLRVELLHEREHDVGEEGQSDGEQAEDG